jgi:hypothetical protein
MLAVIKTRRESMILVTGGAGDAAQLILENSKIKNAMQ